MLSDEDIELPSAMYRKHKLGKRVQRPLVPEVVVPKKQKQKARHVTEVQVAVTTGDAFGTLSSLKQFVITKQAPVPGSTPFDTLLQVMEESTMSDGSVLPLSALQVPLQEPVIICPQPVEEFLQQQALQEPLQQQALQQQHLQEPVIMRPQPLVMVPSSQQPVLSLPNYVPKQLRQMFGSSVSAAVRQLEEWMSQEKWKSKGPCVLWGPCGIGKTLMCTLLAKKYAASFVVYEDELDVVDKVKGWLQSSSRRETGVCAFLNHKSHPNTTNTWLLLDDVDSLEGQCRQEVLALLRGCKQLPGPVLMTCNNIYHKTMAPLQKMKLVLPLKPHNVEHLKQLSKSVNPRLRYCQLTDVANEACGDARRAIIASQFWSLGSTESLESKEQPDTEKRQPEPEKRQPEPEKRQLESRRQHSPFTAAETLFKTPEVDSRALDGHEFMVQTLLYQNYPVVVQNVQTLADVTDTWREWDVMKITEEIPDHTWKYPVAAQNLKTLADVADEWCQFDVIDSIHELPEYTHAYLTFVIPKTCRVPPLQRLMNLQIKPQYMRSSQLVTRSQESGCKANVMH